MKELTLTCVIVLLGYAAHVQAQATCRPDEVKDVNTGMCYYFMDGQEGLQNFDAARRICQARGGDLAIPDSRLTMSFLRNGMIGRQPERYWLGIMEEVDVWRWTDGTVATSQGCYDSSGLSPAFVGEQMSVTMNPLTCQQLCRGRQQDFSAVRYLRGNGNVECMCASDFNPSLEDVVQGCNQVCSGYESKSGPQQLKCGSQDQEDNILVFSSVVRSSEFFNPWSFNQPNNYDNYQGCLALVTDKKRFGDEKCSLRDGMGHICQYDTQGGACKAEAIGGGCVSLHRFGETPNTAFNWFEADKDCKTRGGQLVKIESISFWEAVSAQSNVRDAESKWWIGGFLSKWLFVNGAMIEHSEWAIDEPDQMDEACAATYRNTNSDERFGWEDYDCSTSLNYICQSSVSTTTTTTTTTKAPTPTTATTTTTTTTATTTGDPTTTSTTGAPTITNTTADTPTPRGPSTPRRTPTTQPESTTQAESTTQPESTTQAETTTQAESTTQPESTTQAESTTQPETTTQAEPTSPTPKTTESGVGVAGSSDNLFNIDDNKGSIIAIAIAAVAVLAGFIRLTVFCCQRQGSGDDTDKLAP